MISIFGLVNYSVNLLDLVVYKVAETSYIHFSEEHNTVQKLIKGCSFYAGIITHWLFISRYMTAAFRLPLIFKLTELYREMIWTLMQKRETQGFGFTI